MLSEASALEQERVAKLTSEMTKAIKRHEPNSGLDYWRTGGLNTIGLSANDKRPTYKKVTQINLNFPGAFLPNVNNGAPIKPKKKDHPASAVVLTRSRTSLVPSVSSNTRTQGSTSNPVTQGSKKAMVTDLTCLQLADTLFSSKKSPYAGILNLWPGRSRYTDYFSDNKDTTSNDDNSSDTLSEICMSKNSKQSTWPRNQRGVTIPIMHYKTLPAEQEVMLNNNKIESAITNGHGEDIAIPIHISFSKPQKSILKNGVHKKSSSKTHSPTESPKGGNVGSLSKACSYKLPTTASKSNRVGSAHSDNSVTTLDKITPVLKQPGSRPSSNRSDSYGATNHEYATNGEGLDTMSRKRSVRFNARKEIREYAPCEPVSYC